MGTVYIDLLVIINLYITYFLLKGTGVFLHRKIGAARSIIGAAAGGLTSLAILLPPLPFVGNIAVKVIAGLIITLIAFGYGGFGEYVKNALFFIIINIVFAGLTLLIWLFAAPPGMAYGNGFVYFDISFTALVITTALAYGLIKLLRYVMDVKTSADRVYFVEIANNGATATLPALADSGNMLVDYFSGMSVIICEESAINAIIPEALKAHGGDISTDEDFPSGIRFLPYTTINSAGVIPVFKAERIVIKTDGKPDKSVRALIGVTKEKIDGFNAIFNPKIII